MAIKAITFDDLLRLAPLLNASFGEGFDLADELECFPTPALEGWLYLEDETRDPQGFIRHFAVTEALHVADIYVSPSAQRTQHLARLLASLKGAHGLPAGTRLRFDVSAADTTLLETLPKIYAVTETKTFLHFERLLGDVDRKGLIGVNFTPRTPTELAVAQAILARLKTYPLDELAELLAAERLYLLECEGEIVAALILEVVSEATCQVAVIATMPALEGRSHGHTLLTALLSHCAHLFKRVVLRVDAENARAVRLYRSAGFTATPDGAEVWVYVALA